MSGQMQVHVVSGLAEKAPACVVVEAGGERIVLDLGAGASRMSLGRVDAILATHQHPDHIGGLRGLRGVPVWATPLVAAEIGGRYGLRCQYLPLRGTLGIGGFTVSTGRNGHAPGGVWLHVRRGTDTLLYMGDHSDTCALFPFDPPPAARVVILDASYGFRNDDKAAQVEALMARLMAGPALLPLPAAGRGLEILAVCAARKVPLPAISPQIRACGMAALVEREVLGAAWVPVLAEAIENAPEADPDHLCGRVTLWEDAQLAGTRSRGLVAAAREEQMETILTGHVVAGTPAAALLSEGHARRVGWNIHPTLDENRQLLRRVGAEVCVPAFCDAASVGALAEALGVPFAGARVEAACA